MENLPLRKHAGLVFYGLGSGLCNPGPGELQAQLVFTVSLSRINQPEQLITQLTHIKMRNDSLIMPPNAVSTHSCIPGILNLVQTGPVSVQVFVPTEQLHNRFYLSTTRVFSKDLD